uniref:Uncharacterized protein n=1 Tax=Arundo donax TaxID=35708 RepID=A0A0A9EMB3_ARUDO
MAAASLRMLSYNLQANLPLHIAWTHMDAFLKERNFFRMICVRIFP